MTCLETLNRVSGGVPRTSDLNFISRKRMNSILKLKISKSQLSSSRHIPRLDESKANIKILILESWAPKL